MYKIKSKIAEIDKIMIEMIEAIGISKTFKTLSILKFSTSMRTKEYNIKYIKTIVPTLKFGLFLNLKKMNNKTKNIIKSKIDSYKKVGP